MMMSKLIEHLQEHAAWKIMRFHSDEHYMEFKRLLELGVPAEELEVVGGSHRACPYDISEFFGNLLLNEGIDELHLLLCSTGGVKWDNTNAYLGVGNSSTAEQATDTGLIGASKLYKGMEATYPTYASQVTTWRAQYTDAEANFAWEEFSVSNTSGGDSGDNLNRKTSSEGTKASGTWTLDLAITWS